MQQLQSNNTCIEIKLFRISAPQELPWFCPSVLIYLASIIPAIWILELKTNRREILCSYIKLVREGGEGDERRLNMLLDLMQVGTKPEQRLNLGLGS